MSNRKPKKRSELFVAVQGLSKDVGTLVDQLHALGVAPAESTFDNLRSVLRLLRVEAKESDNPRPRGRFADDHVCESLRGTPIPGRPRATKALVRLAKFLEECIKSRAARGEPTQLELEQLAAVVLLADQSHGGDQEEEP